jgi:outer membrane protein assembly factor BamB
MGNIAETDNVFCFDALTGKLNWKHEYPCSSKDPNGYLGTRSTPTVDGDCVYTLSREGHFFCLDATSGKVKWAKDFQKDFGSEPPKWGFAGSPLIEQDWVLTEGGGKNKTSVIAFNKHTGQVIWQVGTDGAGYASLIPLNLGGERCFLQFSTDQLICHKMKDGAELWRTPWATSYGVNSATPVINGNEIFLSSGYNFGCALFKATAAGAQEVWRNKNMRNHVNTCVLVKGSLYGYDEKELRCLDWKTGQVKWSANGYGKGAICSADGKLILYSQTGKLGLAEATPEAFKEMSAFQALSGKDTWANPVLANGIIYLRSMDKLVALDVRKNL